MRFLREVEQRLVEALARVQASPQRQTRLNSPLGRRWPEDPLAGRASPHLLEACEERGFAIEENARAKKSGLVMSWRGTERGVRGASVWGDLLARPKHRSIPREWPPVPPPLSQRRKKGPIHPRAASKRAI